MTELRRPTKRKPMTKEEAKQYVVAAVEASPPRTRNPFNEALRTCVYDDGKSHTCIAGRVMLDAGVVKKTRELTENRGIQRALENHPNGDRVSGQAYGLLLKVQDIFDGKPHQTPTWRQALTECRRQGVI